MADQINILISNFCISCNNEFSSSNIPYKLNTCVHTICDKCLDAIIICPYDNCNQQFDKMLCQINHVSCLGIQDVPATIKSSKCRKPRHGRYDINYRCSTCQQNVCARCMAEDHLHHTTERELLMLHDANVQNLKELDGLITGDISMKKMELQKLLEKNKENEEQYRVSNRGYNQIVDKFMDRNQDIENSLNIFETNNKPEIANAFDTPLQNLKQHGEDIHQKK